MLWSPPSHHPFVSTFFASPKQTRCSQLQRAIAGLGVGIPGIPWSIKASMEDEGVDWTSIFVLSPPYLSFGIVLVQYLSSPVSYCFFKKYPDRSGCLLAPVDVKSSERTFKSIVTWTKTWKSVKKDPGKKSNSWNSASGQKFISIF